MGYPRMLYRDGKESTWDGRGIASRIVASAGEEAAAQAEGWMLADDFWAAPPKKAVDPFDQDGDGKPGGSKASEQSDELAELRIAYKLKHGKRPFNGWDADELRRRMA